MTRKVNTKDRATKNREIRRENLRLELKGKQYLHHIEKDYQELCLLSTTVKKARSTKTNLHGMSDTLAKVDARHKILKTKLDTNFRRLAKVLPDLKAVELSDSGGGSFAEAFAKAMVRRSAK